MIDAGTVIDGFRIERPLGRGGMGVVYEATQLSLERRLALKLLRPELSEDPLFVERFRREGRLQAALDHPHVLPVYEAGESEHGLYLAMRLVRGKSLAELLDERSLGGERALRLLRQVAGALDAAHAAGLVHRDVKPRNVLVDPSEHAYLADFGLTRIGGESGVTASGELVGTVAYLAPEVIAGEPATPASDRYAFAAMLFECLAGEPVFPRASDAAVLYAHTSERRPRITERRPELPRELDAVLANALDKDPAKRHESAAAIVEAAERARRPAGRRRRRRMRAGSAAFGAAAATGALALGTVGGEGAPDRAPAPPLLRGAKAIGSGLQAGGVRSVDCRGSRPTGSSPGCTVVQTRLPGRPLSVNRAGAIRRWTVRGARGDLALQVVRPRHGSYRQITRSQFASVPNEGVHSFAADLRIEPGDLVGLEVTPGAAIGVREGLRGATTGRWLDRLRVQYRPPTFAAGTGLDSEVLLRADYVPGARPSLPSLLTGRRAAVAPRGRVIGSEYVEVPGRRLRRVAVVRLPGRVALDLFLGSSRRARLGVPDADPRGRLLLLRVEFPLVDPGPELTWRNPDGTIVMHQYKVGAGSLRPIY